MQGIGQTNLLAFLLLVVVLFCLLLLFFIREGSQSTDFIPKVPKM